MIKFKVPLKMYSFDIEVIYGTVADLRHRYPQGEIDIFNEGSGGGHLVKMHDDVMLDHVIWVNSFYGFNLDTVTTITHEVGHCLFSIFEYVDIRIGPECADHHAFLYAQSYLISEIVKKLRRKVKFRQE